MLESVLFVLSICNVYTVGLPASSYLPPWKHIPDILVTESKRQGPTAQILLFEQYI